MIGGVGEPLIALTRSTPLLDSIVCSVIIELVFFRGGIIAGRLRLRNPKNGRFAPLSQDHACHQDRHPYPKEVV